MDYKNYKMLRLIGSSIAKLILKLQISALFCSFIAIYQIFAWREELLYLNGIILSVSG
jgi:hypothetical protein